MVIAFSTFKGGVAKTSLAVNTAAQWARSGACAAPVRVFDLDTTQQDAGHFADALGALGVPVVSAEAATLRRQVFEAGPGASLLDTNPKATAEMAAALALADVVVIPVVEVLSLKNAAGFLEMLEAARQAPGGKRSLRTVYALTMQERGTRERALIEEEAREAFGADLLPCALHRSTLWRSAARAKQDLESFDRRHAATREAARFARVLWEKIHDVN